MKVFENPKIQVMGVLEKNPRSISKSSLYVLLVNMCGKGGERLKKIITLRHIVIRGLHRNNLQNLFLCLIPKHHMASLASDTSLEDSLDEGFYKKIYTCEKSTKRRN